MKFKKSLIYLVISIIVLSIFSSLVGILSQGGNGEYEIRSFHGEIVKIYGVGIYKNDSISIAAQGIASDIVTLVIGVPLLGISLFLANKGSFRGQLILTGTIGYFLYTYMSYTFLWNYNPMFIVYVMIMSLSLYAFIISIMSYELDAISNQFDEKLPVKFLGGFQIFIAVMIGLLWLGKIAPTIISGTIPEGLDHYTTLVIQAMDLGFVVPTAFLSGILLIKRKPFGYLLSSIIIIKGITLLLSISAMIINMALNNVRISLIEVIIFPLFNLIAVIAFIILLKYTKSKTRENII